MEKDATKMTKYEYNGISVLVDEFAEPWMTQKQMTEMLGISTPSLSDILSTAYKNKHLGENTHISLRLTHPDGRSFNTKHYNLDAILLVGFRSKATQEAIAFRHWISQIVREYLGQSKDQKIKMLEEIVENQQRIIHVLQKNHADSHNLLNEMQQKIVALNLSYATEEMRIEVLQGQLQKLVDNNTSKKYLLRLNPEE